jgi:S-adenosylmethionine decarboxylase proenzyme
VTVGAQPIVEAARLHVIADVSDVDDVLLDDPDRLEAIIVAACTDAGATVLDTLVHHFTPAGVTVLALLAESHASLHSWPEVGCCFLDAFTCGDVHPDRIIAGVLERLGTHTARIATVSTGHNNPT